MAANNGKWEINIKLLPIRALSVKIKITKKGNKN